MDIPFYSNISKELKRSLPAGLGLSETQITTHGFDSTEEGTIGVGPFQGNRIQCVLLINREHPVTFNLHTVISAVKCTC